MIELFDVFYEALDQQIPIETTKYDQFFCEDSIRNIREYLRVRVGDMVIFTRLDGKKYSEPVVAQIYKMTPSGVVVRYKCYDSNGVFTCYLLAEASFNEIYSRHSIIKVFGEV